MRKGMTIEDATHEWVGQFNAFPTDMIRIVNDYGEHPFREVTPGREDENDFGDLPAWSAMWSFSDSADDYWLESLGGKQIMADCGFQVYESEEFGYIFGIEGGGYNFYTDHWIPLYKARGLQWHDPDIDKKVKITCYGKTEEMTRTEAIEKYLEAVQGSEGAERDRYLQIYWQLQEGKMEVSDEVDL